MARYANTIYTWYNLKLSKKVKKSPLGDFLPKYITLMKYMKSGYLSKTLYRFVRNW